MRQGSGAQGEEKKHKHRELVAQECAFGTTTLHVSLTSLTLGGVREPPRITPRG